MNTLLVNFSSA